VNIHELCGTCCECALEVGNISSFRLIRRTRARVVLSRFQNIKGKINTVKKVQDSIKIKAYI